VSILQQITENGYLIPNLFHSHAVNSKSFPFPSLSLIPVVVGFPMAHSHSHWESHVHCHFRCCAPAVYNSLPKTTVNGDSVAVYKSRLNTRFPRFLPSLFSVSRCMAPAPLNLRSYGSKQICLLLLLLLFLGEGGYPR